MEIKDLKTIDVNAFEWFDKVNGNSYFSAIMTLNYSLKDEEIIKLPFQYGYGSHYEEMALEEILYFFKLDKKLYSSLWRFCEENNIILRTNKTENCLKRDLKLQ